LQIIDLKDLQGRSSARYIAFGQVVGVRSRVCGYADYSVVDKVFAMAQPKVLFPKQDAAK
jgi:hypothetical protein